MPASPNPPEDPLARFKLSIRKYTRRAKACGRDYVLVEKFKRECLQESDIEKLLATIYRDVPGQPTEASTIYKHSQIVLMILIESGLQPLGWLIEVFLRQGIDDGKLPCSRHELVESVRLEDDTDDLAAQVADAFFQTQWKFLAHKFGERENATITAERIVPIVDRKEINKKGGYARLFEIVVLKEFVSETLRKAISKHSFTPTSCNDGDGERYTLALKTFATKADGKEVTAYRVEKAAFDGLRGRAGIVKCLGCYKHSEPSVLSNDGASAAKLPIHTNNILLEFGDMDLEEYFYLIEPPIFQDEIEKFWMLLFPVAKALNEIHNFRSLSGQEVVLYKGWHADIKPANILFIRDVFKLADLGFVKFMQENAASEPLLNEFNGGTWSYGAPETLDPKQRRAVTQAIDIWSLGCVFSEAASWMLGGSAAVKAFTQVRLKAVGRANICPESLNDLKSGDCFHDGHAVLKDVLDWHNVLRQSMRKNDNITGQILDLVENKMLVEDPKNRITAQQLGKELDYIIENAKKANGYVIPETIMNALLNVDQTGSSNA